MALSNGVGLGPALASGGGGSSSASSIGSGGSAGVGATGSEGRDVAFGGAETALAGLASWGCGLGGATTGRGATGWRVGGSMAVAGLTAGTTPGGGGTRFHGFQTARAPARPSTAATATSTAVRERLAGWVGPGAGFIGWVGWATRGGGTNAAVGAPEKASASTSANSQQLVKRSDGDLARAFATTASTSRGRAAFRVLGGGASLTIL